MLDEITVTKQLEETFKPLKFEKQRHLYFWNGIKVPISVSGLVSKHCYPFEREKYLKLCSKKEGITEKELAARWDYKRDNACAEGTSTHSFLEVFNGTQAPMTPLEQAGVEFFRKLDGGRYKILKRELMVFSKKYSYAGTLDLPLWDTHTQSIVIADWKTNIDLYKCYDNMKPPFEYLEAHPYNKYQLQLSYYQLALEEWGYKVSDRILVYLKRDGEVETYPLYDFTELLRRHLN